MTIKVFKLSKVLKYGIAMLLLATITSADSIYPRLDIMSGYDVDILTRAVADEYYFGHGSSNNLYVAGGIDLDQCYVENGLPIPKVNEAYIWGIAKSGDNIFFGTVANGNILVTGTYFSDITGNPDSSTGSVSYVEASEFSNSIFAKNLGLPGRYGDWRPPNLYRYNLPTRTLTRLTPTLPQQARDHLFSLEGVRSGGSVAPNTKNPNGLIVLAGPPLREDLGGGVGFFAFDAAGNFLGSTIRSDYANIRRFVEINGDLYAGVQTTDGYGKVIRIINRAADPRFPFSIMEVGDLDQPGADIAVHDGRLFLTTWPGYIEGGSIDSVKNPLDFLRRATGLWMSPKVPANGLTIAHRKQWVKVWNVNMYEADLAVAVTYGGGALCSFDGWLYFGTMHVPLMGPLAVAIKNNFPLVAPQPVGSPAYLAWYAKAAVLYANSERAASAFRGRNFFKPPSIAGIALKPGGEFELLSGYESFKVLDNDGTNWVTKANLMGQKPRLATAGWGSPYNFYTWTMSVYKKNLYIGTFDTSMATKKETFLPGIENPNTTWGADLIMIPSSIATKYYPVSRNGLGNPANYGFRTMLATDDTLYIGTANPYNLLGDPDDGLPDGGWELLALTKNDPVPFDIDGDYISDPAWDHLDGSATVLSTASEQKKTYNGVKLGLPAWADYDGDGRTDPGWFLPASGQWLAALSASASTSNTLLATTRRVPLNVTPVPADFDGNGCANPAVFNKSGGQILWLNSNGKWVTKSPGASTRGALPAVGDYDGDGIADPAWYYPTGGNWIMMCSRDGRKTLRTLPIRGVPMPADFDGDGIADFALHLPLTGEIAIVKYSSGLPPFVTEENLGPGWTPMSGDYDGDGRADFAWYNFDSKQMHVLYANGDSETFNLNQAVTALARPASSPPLSHYLLLR